MDFPLRTRTRNSISSLATTNDYLGLSYHLNHFPLGTALNLGSPIVNIAKIRAEESYYVRETDLGIQEITSFSYSGFDRYTYKSKDTEKISSGANLNFGIIQIRNKNTIEKVFTTSVANEKQRIFGQLDVNVLGKRHKLTISSNMINKIMFKYLDPFFLEELYSITPKEFVDIYGGLVLVDYYSGGRLTALYSEVYNSSDNVTTQEKNMDMDISATYGANKDGAGETGNIGIGSKYYRNEEVSQKISNTTLSIKAIGGNLNYAAFSAPQSISSVDIDLSQWMSSLTTDTYRMIDIEKAGLLPISDIIIEQNLKGHIDRATIYGSPYEGSYDRIKEPYMEIRRRGVAGQIVLFCSLVNKIGDRIIIDVSNVTGQSEAAIEYRISEMVDKCNELCGLEIRKVTLNSDTDYLIPSSYLDFTASPNSNYKYVKYIDKENNKMYILREESLPREGGQGKLVTFIDELDSMAKFSFSEKREYRVGQPMKVGWTMYNYKRALNLYGLTDFVDKIPEVTMDREELLDYELFSL